MPLPEPDLRRTWLFGDGLWVEVPTYRNARRLIERARRLGVDGV